MLFGNGSGMSTIGPITCDWCGIKHHEDNEDEEGEIIDYEVESVAFTDFAGKQICSCCFKHIDSEVLSHMDDIIVWFKKIQGNRRSRLEKNEKLLKSVSA